MNQDVKLKVIDLLKGRGAYHVSRNGKQHYTRCPFCGDSSNQSHAHLSIKIDIESDEPMMYRCLKCSASGLLTETTLEELDIHLESEFRKELKNYNKKSMRLSKLVNLDCERYTVPLYTESLLNNEKLNYLNNRLGLNLSYENARKNKVILNLFDFMVFNDLKSIPDQSYSTLKRLNDDYIGFLSCNNNCIVFRNIRDNDGYRYYKVILNEKNLNPDTFFSIPNSIPLMYTHSINVHMAEGIFDILSIQNNVVNSMDGNYYYATCGFGGITVLKYLLHHGINTGINLHIYSDNDKTDWDHKRYLYNGSYITEWIDNIYIHRNGYNYEKDYGVPKDHIIDNQYSIK